MVRIFRTRSTIIKMDFDVLGKYVDILTQANEYRNMLYNAWVEDYKTFMRSRFRTKGGGTWPPLSRRTKKRMRPRSRLILRDTDTLYNVWQAGSSNPGYFEKRIKRGVRFGYGGGARHPIATHLTIKRLAEIHSRGLGRVPQRRIVVDPPEKLERKLANRVVKYANDAKKRLRMT